MDIVDCDVHCAPDSYDALFPYLSDYWRQYITEAGIRLNGLAHAYPRGVAPPAPSSYEALAERVLGGSAAAQVVVLNCLTGFETHRNAYFSAAVASAINDWVREEFLARDSRLRAKRGRFGCVARRRRVGDRASGGGLAVRPGSPAGAKRSAVGTQEQPRHGRRRT
jgi:hypothetical protein